LGECELEHPTRRWTFSTEKLSNLRDLGGYACQGGSTRYGAVLRSDQPCGLTEAEKDFLVAKGLTDVIDLRSDDECSEFPNAFADHSSVTLHHYNLKADLGVVRTDIDDTMGALYVQTLESRGAVIASIVAVVAESPGLVLVHCFAGKDRTGIIAAMILLSLGVAEQDVIADYQVSEVHLSRKFERFLSLVPDFPLYKLSSGSENMKRMLDHIRATYGNASVYLEIHGFSRQSLDKLKTKLLVQAL